MTGCRGSWRANPLGIGAGWAVGAQGKLRWGRDEGSAGGRPGWREEQRERYRGVTVGIFGIGGGGSGEAGGGVEGQGGRTQEGRRGLAEGVWAGMLRSHEAFRAIGREGAWETAGVGWDARGGGEAGARSGGRRGRGGSLEVRGDGWG